MKEKILVICGPTATGKSALAVELAKCFGGEVISADSRQVYRGLDIGSAKITPDEMQGVPHHMIDSADPHDTYTVAQFQEEAREKMRSIFSRGHLPIICGGTGMYIDALVSETSFPTVPPDHLLRQELENYETRRLFELLKDHDPKRAKSIDPNNRPRLIRALEIATHLGSVPEITSPESPYSTLWIGLTLPKEILQQRIITRINDRIPTLFEEIKKLNAAGVTFERLSSFGLEYRYGSEYVQGNITQEQFTELLATKTWQFAKRQMTWFKKNNNIHWFDPLAQKEKILNQVQDFMKLT
jgi:tRNA dimethylallyltransferase